MGLGGVAAAPRSVLAAHLLQVREAAPLFQVSLIETARTVRASQNANAAATMHQRHMSGLPITTLHEIPVYTGPSASTPAWLENSGKRGNPWPSKGSHAELRRERHTNFAARVADKTGDHELLRSERNDRVPRGTRVKLVSCRPGGPRRSDALALFTACLQDAFSVARVFVRASNT